MNSKTRILEIAGRRNPDKVGFWLGTPLPQTLQLYGSQLKLPTERVFDYFDSDCCFVCADLCDPWKHPEKKPAIWDFCEIGKKQSDGLAGPLANISSVNEVDGLDWPDSKYLDFSDASTKLRNVKYRDKAVLSGSWSHFFHIVADLFGMEQYLIKMHTDPAVVEAVTERVIDFFVGANELFCQSCAQYCDVMFYGNDFGCQQDMIMSPAMFEKFIMSGLSRLIHVAKKYNKPVMLHSCGSIYKIIPVLIDAGVDMLHPLQAKAVGMDAITLAKLYRGKISFVGGVDTQDLLVNGTPQMVMDEVHRLRNVLGPHYIVSPSHEALLPNVSLENAKAMLTAARD